ncbi:MAG: 6-carboxytetrahydropterin synthase [Myxococcales bacterium]|nr:6-carboxytetrahydropterin synthase [Myxococcota bacterium]MDW8281628.1 6-carboxytetrahydropterin synthase [Myxococcales bacterium]
MGRHRLQIVQERHKFSAAHMTVFPDGSKERLHGHNFQLTLRLWVRSVALPDLCDFSVLKRAMAELCGELNERTLVALGNPHLRVTVESLSEGETQPGRDLVHLSHPDGEYLLPRSDVVLLPVDNVTAEQLAVWAHGELCRRLRGKLPEVVESLEVTVLETPGQGASYEAPMDRDR